MRSLSLIIFSFFLIAASWAQEQDIQPEYTFTLEEALIFGVKNNYSARIAEKEVERTIKQNGKSFPRVYLKSPGT